MNIYKHKSLLEYIGMHHDWFCVDESNQRLIQLLSLYAKGNQRFEEIEEPKFKFGDQQKLYLEKGILLIGNVGTGKTELLKMMNSYYRFINRKEVQFRVANIPDIADSFSMKGREAFNLVKSGNWMFDELCFLDEHSKTPDREYAMNYGDKILIGGKLIYDRYNIFKESGWQSHFTTNATLPQLKEIYGERVWSRLLEMCNIFIYTGADRRPNRRPHITRNYNNGTVKIIQEAPPKSEANELIPPTTDKEGLQNSYEAFSNQGNWLFIHRSEYDLLKQFGCLVDELEGYMIELRAESPMAGDDILERYAKQKATAAYYTRIKESGINSLPFTK